MSTWIPISERLPTREDADERGEVVCRWADGTTCTGRFDDRGDEDDPAVAWLPIPPYTPPKPEPTGNECTELIYRITNERWDESAVKGWFADVTARIEKEEGT